MERHEELLYGQDHYSAEVRAELLTKSSAPIDRYVRGAKARGQITGKSATKASPLLRTSVKTRKGTDEVGAAPARRGGLSVRLRP